MVKRSNVGPLSEMLSWNSRGSAAWSFSRSDRSWSDQRRVETALEGSEYVAMQVASAFESFARADSVSARWSTSRLRRDDAFDLARWSVANA